ncbi:hypothetical protein BCD49_36310 [Pseudofrankia sp. EUN1h]|nr:hypothetical protein BCD49_36310 [Pseudofrankia sp. EUN1h]
MRAAVDFYVAARLRNPDLLDLTGNSKWDELAKPAAQRGEWKTIQDCTDYQDLAILSYQLAIDALLAGDSAGADNFALLANSAEQLSVNCIQIFL